MKESKKKKPLIGFIVADDKHLSLANMLMNSIRKFHTKEEFPIDIITGTELKNYLDADPQFYYRATPVVAQKYINEYDTVIKLDADQIVLDDLRRILSYKDYDVGTVLNYNRLDPRTYGDITVASVDPRDYFNCGFVAMRSPEFVRLWARLCFTNHFTKLRFREQDLLNLLCHFGNFKVRCFDFYDAMHGYWGWHGLILKGETNRIELRDGKPVLPKGDDNYPPMDIQAKIFHQGGGNNEIKGNWKIWFTDEVNEYIDWLVSEEKDV